MSWMIVFLTLILNKLQLNKAQLQTVREIRKKTVENYFKWKIPKQIY